MMKENCKDAYEQLSKIHEWTDSADQWNFADSVRTLIEDPSFVRRADWEADALVVPSSLSDFLRDTEDGSAILSCLVGAILGVIVEVGHEQKF